MLDKLIIILYNNFYYNGKMVYWHKIYTEKERGSEMCNANTVRNDYPCMKKLGFGLMRLPKDETTGNIDIELSKKMVDKYLEAGFTYFDTAFVYASGESEKAVRPLLSDRYERSKYVLATKLALWLVNKPEDMEEQFRVQLERTGAGYFDFYLLHSMDSARFEFAEKIGAWDFVKGLKEKGLVKHIGFSFHDKADVLDRALTAHPEAEFVQLQINYRDWEDNGIQSRLCYEVARRHGKEVVIMEPVKGGALATLAPEAAEVLKAADPDASVASWAVRFSASLEGVFTVLSGMSDMEQLLDNTGYMKEFAPLSEEELNTVNRVRKILEEIKRVECTACSYCTEGCPAKINIPKLFSVYNDYLTYGNKKGAAARYSSIVKESGKASECIGCEQCSDICPQHLPVPMLLKSVAEALE